MSVMTGGARPPAPPLQLELITDVRSAFYVHLEMADRPGVLASVTRVLGDHGVSIKSVVQRGLGEHARLVMVTHPLLESQLRAVLQGVADGSFRPIVDLEVPLSEARRAHERLEQRQNFGKVVLVA